MIVHNAPIVIGAFVFATVMCWISGFSFGYGQGKKKRRCQVGAELTAAAKRLSPLLRGRAGVVILDE